MDRQKVGQMGGWKDRWKDRWTDSILQAKNGGPKI